jgi:hypothetical protein
LAADVAATAEDLAGRDRAYEGVRRDRACRSDIGECGAVIWAPSPRHKRIAVLTAGLSACGMAGPLARMAGSHARAQPSHARPKSLPLARGDAGKAGQGRRTGILFSRTKNVMMAWVNISGRPRLAGSISDEATNRVGEAFLGEATRRHPDCRCNLEPAPPAPGANVYHAPRVSAHHERRAPRRVGATSRRRRDGPAR